MIHMADVTGYQVGDKVFQKGALYTDERGVSYFDQAYHLAWNEMNATGLPIVTLGEDYSAKLERIAAESAARDAAKKAKLEARA